MWCPENKIDWVIIYSLKGDIVQTHLVMERLPSNLPDPHLAGAESPEVLAGLGGGISKELHHHPAHGNSPDADVEETSWLFDAHSLYFLNN